MIKRILALDGVHVICLFRDDGALVESFGLISQKQMTALAGFAHGYKRIVQGNADQLSMFTQMSGWTPPRGWIVRGAQMAVLSVGNLVCMVDTREANLTEVMSELEELSHY